MAKKHSRRRDEDDDDDAPAVDKPRSDAYVGLLAISLLALITGAVLLYLDYDELAKAQSPPPAVTLSDNGLTLPKPGAPAPKA